MYFSCGKLQDGLGSTDSRQSRFAISLMFSLFHLYAVFYGLLKSRLCIGATKLLSTDFRWHICNEQCLNCPYPSGDDENIFYWMIFSDAIFAVHLLLNILHRFLSASVLRRIIQDLPMLWKIQARQCLSWFTGFIC